jgi:hypothetical protein
VAYFPDLAPYAYGHGPHPGVIHVGWLDGEHPFSKGPVERWLVEKMKTLAVNPVALHRGQHICEVCVQPGDLERTRLPDRVVLDPNCSWVRWAEQRWGNGEIRVAGDGVVFAAPVLIVHYIEERDYLPPDQFLKAVAAF